MCWHQLNFETAVNHKKLQRCRIWTHDHLFTCQLFWPPPPSRPVLTQLISNCRCQGAAAAQDFFSKMKIFEGGKTFSSWFLFFILPPAKGSSCRFKNYFSNKKCEAPFHFFMIQSLLHSLSRKEREKGGPGPNPMNNKQACIYKLVNTFF